MTTSPQHGDRMDTWVIIVIAVVLIAIFIPLLARGMFGSTRGDGTEKRSGEEPTDFSDDPPKPRS